MFLTCAQSCGHHTCGLACVVFLPDSLASTSLEGRQLLTKETRGKDIPGGSNGRAGSKPGDAAEQWPLVSGLPSRAPAVTGVGRALAQVAKVWDAGLPVSGPVPPLWAADEDTVQPPHQASCHSEGHSGEGHVLCFKGSRPSPGRVAQLVGASSRVPQGYGFDPRSGHVWEASN